MPPQDEDSHDVKQVQAEKLPGALSEEEQEKAARLIQRTYRGHRTRRGLGGFGLDASTRWYEAVKDAQFREITSPISPKQHDSTPGSQNESPSFPAKANWNRVVGIARHAGNDDRSPSITDESEDQEDATPVDGGGKDGVVPKPPGHNAFPKNTKSAKQMELQYWLELVDHKHRHGSPLRKYHAYWMKQNTTQNFFEWLDDEPQLSLDLPDCTRKKLDSQQVRYLSREERMDYLVKINEEGLLIWAKNGEPVWTKDELFKDSMRGIVPTNDPTPAFKYNVKPEHSTVNKSPSSNSSDTEDSSTDEEDDPAFDPTAADEGAEYVNEDFHRASGPKKIKYVSAGVLFNHMIRTSLRKGHKWIFVADTSFRLYIGYKQAGSFQHSSILSGARILAAGQIKVKHGQLRRLSPLSGHYRPAAVNFRAFIHHLKEAGCDMSHVSISQSYAVLVGLEGYVKTRRRVKSVEKSVAHQKDRVLNPEKAKEDEEAQQDKSKSAQKERLFIEQQKMAESKSANQSKLDKKSSHTLSRLFNRFRSKNTGSQGVRESGPEGGIPPPDGKL